MKTQIQVGENILSLKDVEDVAFRRVSVDLSEGCASNLVDRRKDVEAFLLPDAPPAYGINTGFGALAETQVKVEEVEELQANLIRSHCTGIGEPFSGTDYSRHHASACSRACETNEWRSPRITPNAL